MANWHLQEMDRIQSSRGADLDGEFEHDVSDPAASPTTPLAFGTPGRRTSYVRSQSMNGRIQKPSVVRSQSFNGSKCSKLMHRSHHMDSMQGQLLNYMKSTGVDQQKVVHVLEKLKEMYLSRGEQQLDHSSLKTSRPSSPATPAGTFSGNKTPLRLEEPPVEVSTITLLKHKFEQLERYKESIEGQRIQLYPSQNLQGQPPAPRTPGSSAPGSPLIVPNDLYYQFDEGTAAILAQQQELFSSSSRSGTSGTVSPKEPMGSSGDSSPASSDVPSRGDEAAHALLHYMLQPPSGHWQNVTTLTQKTVVAGEIRSRSGSGSLGALFAESIEPQVVVPVKKPTTDVTVRKTNLSASIERAMAKFPFSRSVKRSSPKLKFPVRWGSGLSLHTPFSTGSMEPDYFGRSESSGATSDVWRKSPDSDWSEEIYASRMDLDTSLHL